MEKSALLALEDSILTCIKNRKKHTKWSHLSPNQQNKTYSFNLAQECKLLTVNLKCTNLQW